MFTAISFPLSAAFTASHTFCYIVFLFSLNTLIIRVFSNFPLISSFTCWLDCVAELLHRASLIAQLVKNSPAMQETLVRSLNREDPLDQGMATHSSILAWETPWTEEPGGLQSMGSQRVGHD